MNTGRRHIAEASKDLFCGIGKQLKDIDVLDVQSWLGRNIMGKCLEEVRSKLKHR